MRAVCWLVAIAMGTSAWADCAPEKMVRVVIRDATPSAAGTFAAEPKTIYRLGSHYARIEEQPDPQLGIHGLIVTNQRDTWMINLADSTGKHIVDKADSYDFHAPILGWTESSLVELEYGCELEFMAERGIEPVEVTLGDKKLLQYEVSADTTTIRLLVDPVSDLPWAVGVIEDGTPTYLARYDEYEAGIEPDNQLFAKPSGIEFVEAKQP